MGTYCEKFINRFIKHDFVLNGNELANFKKFLGYRVNLAKYPHLEDLLGKFFYKALLSKNCKYKNSIFNMATRSLQMSPMEKDKRQKKIDTYHLFGAIYKGYHKTVLKLIKKYKPSEDILHGKIWTGGSTARFFAFEIHYDIREQLSRNKHNAEKIKKLKAIEETLKVILNHSPAMFKMLETRNIIKNGGPGNEILQFCDSTTLRKITLARRNYQAKGYDPYLFKVFSDNNPKQQFPQQHHTTELFKLQKAAYKELTKRETELENSDFFPRYDSGPSHLLILRKNGTARYFDSKNKLGREISFDSKIIQIGHVPTHQGFNQLMFLLENSTVMRENTNDLNNRQNNMSKEFKLKKVQQIACGKGHVLFLLKGGTVKSWGRNTLGQLGRNNRQVCGNVDIPSSSPVIQIAAGCFHSLFLLKNGKVLSCGSNEYGELGRNFYSNSPGRGFGDYRNYGPTPILDGVKQIAAGNYHSLFLKEDNTVWGCGSNLKGQLGYKCGFNWGENFFKWKKPAKIYIENNFKHAKITRIEAAGHHSKVLLNTQYFEDNKYKCESEEMLLFYQNSPSKEQIFFPGNMSIEDWQKHPSLKNLKKVETLPWGDNILVQFSRREEDFLVNFQCLSDSQGVALEDHRNEAPSYWIPPKDLFGKL